MNKILITILFAILFYQIPVSCVSNPSQHTQFEAIECAPALQQSLNAIQQIPEARTLIASIQKEGSIRIVAENTAISSQFGAFWDPDHRVICVAVSPHHTKGDLIGSILFELHNAAGNSKITQIDQLAATGQIDKANYVRSMEYLEYQNSLSTAKIAEKGIQMGVLPRDARLPTFRNFEEHFAAQQQSGHSACFAQNYDNLIHNKMYY